MGRRRASPCGALNVRYISLFVWEGGNTDGRVSPELANASDQTAHAGAMSPRPRRRAHAGVRIPTLLARACLPRALSPPCLKQPLGCGPSSFHGCWLNSFFCSQQRVRTLDVQRHSAPQRSLSVLQPKTAGYSSNELLVE